MQATVPTCSACGDIPERLARAWLEPTEEPPAWPASVQRLRAVAGWDAGGRGEKLLRCGACGAWFRWWAQFEVRSSGCDNSEDIEHLVAEETARLREALAPLDTSSPARPTYDARLSGGCNLYVPPRPSPTWDRFVEGGGVFIPDEKAPPAGSAVWVHLRFPGGYEIDIGGTVAWLFPGGEHTPAGFGVRIVDCREMGWRLMSRTLRGREPMYLEEYA